jgi:CheY-like chemotaxis protein
LAPVLVGDPSRLHQILLNLINNSIKFTESGHIIVSCRVLAQSNDTQTVAFSVADTGIGIDETKLATIFDSFTQEDASITRRYGGTGLGLSICKKLVEMQGGSIEATSYKGKGSTFTFVIPYPIGNTADLPNQLPPVDEVMQGQGLQGLRVLLAEDNEINRFLATTVLENWKITVETAENGQIAIEKVYEQVYDIILMDMQMPVLDGLEATRELRRMGFQMPIIALTANAVQGDEERCLQAGMNDYVSKPFDEAVLYKKLAKLSGRDTHQYSSSTTYDMSESLYNLDKITKMSQGNKAFVKRMLELFVAHTPSAVLEMEVAYKAGQYDKVKSIAHTLKPSFEMLGLQPLGAEIKLIEQYAGQQTNLDALDEMLRRTFKMVPQILAHFEKEIAALS